MKIPQTSSILRMKNTTPTDTTQKKAALMSDLFVRKIFRKSVKLLQKR